MTPEELFEQIMQLSPQQRQLLGYYTEILVDVIKHQHLPAMLVRVLPSKADAPSETVVAYCLSHSMAASTVMLFEFAEARRVLAEAEAMMDTNINQKAH